MGLFELRLAYSYTEATFQSTFYTVSPHNSTADFNQNSQASTNLPELGAFNSLPSPTASANGGRGTYHMIRIDPGARLPGIPEHNYNGTLTLNITPAWKIGLDATDKWPGETSREVMTPHFRDRRYGDGLAAGVERIIGRIAQGRGVTLDGVRVPRQSTRR